MNLCISTEVKAAVHSGQSNTLRDARKRQKAVLRRAIRIFTQNACENASLFISREQ